jgi:hypothetical protein
MPSFRSRSDLAASNDQRHSSIVEQQWSSRRAHGFHAQCNILRALMIFDERFPSPNTLLRFHPPRPGPTLDRA